MRQAIEWGKRSWNEVSATTVQNCWRKVEILPREVQLLRVGPSDCVMQELAELLTFFAKTSGDPRLPSPAIINGCVLCLSAFKMHMPGTYTL